jgi:hypothetical protein
VAWDEIASPTVAELWRGRAEFALKATPQQVVLAHEQLWKTYAIAHTIIKMVYHIIKERVLYLEPELKDFIFRGIFSLSSTVLMRTKFLPENDSRGEG